MHIFAGQENCLPGYREVPSDRRVVLIFGRGGLIECLFMWCRGALVVRESRALFERAGV